MPKAAIVAIVVVQWFQTTSVFLATAVASILAAIAVVLIRPRDLRTDIADSSNAVSQAAKAPLSALFRDRRVCVLLVSAALFHLANAPVMPLVAQKIKSVGGGDTHVASVVLIAQMVMVPTSLLAGLMGSRLGHKRVLALGFAVLPMRILCYTLTDDPQTLVLLQGLDGIGVGIFDVTVVAVCADVSLECGRFNTLAGAIATAGGIGGVVGPVLGGFLVQIHGFSSAFLVFSSIAALAAFVFMVWMPGSSFPPGFSELKLLHETYSLADTSSTITGD